MAGVINEVAAARFFASYNLANHAPICTPAPADFSARTDTSLSQLDPEDGVGKVISGSLLFDLPEHKTTVGLFSTKL